MVNIHSAGETLASAVTAGVTTHTVKLVRDTESVEFAASSGPIGTPVLLAEQGLIVSQSDRVFFWNVTAPGDFGMPRIGDVVVDVSDDSRWRILPTASDNGWQWHGQGRTMVQVFTKQEQVVRSC